MDPISYKKSPLLLEYSRSIPGLNTSSPEIQPAFHFEYKGQSEETQKKMKRMIKTDYGDKQIKRMSKNFNADFHVVQEYSPEIKQKAVIVELPAKVKDPRKSNNSKITDMGQRKSAMSNSKSSTSQQRKEFNSDVKIVEYSKF